MGSQGSTTVNFGTFPGGTDTTVAVTGQAGIAGGSLVEVWVPAVATADHSADEHWLDPPYVTAGNIQAGTGFTIYAKAPDVWSGYSTVQPTPPDATNRMYGQYTVFWVWN